MKDVLLEAGIEVTKDNKKDIDRIIHELVEVEYKDCSPAWKGVKEKIKQDENAKRQFIDALKSKIG